MGYTHYWRKPKWIEEDQEGYSKALPLIRKALKESPCPLQWESDDPRKPSVTRKRIRFNGVGEDGHETFYFTTGTEDRFQFCKTARKPYDWAVCVVLEILDRFCPSLEVSSDGDEEEENWPSARAWVDRVAK